MARVHKNKKLTDISRRARADAFMSLARKLLKKEEKERKEAFIRRLEFEKKFLK